MRWVLGVNRADKVPSTAGGKPTSPRSGSCYCIIVDFGNYSRKARICSLRAALENGVSFLLAHKAPHLAGVTKPLHLASGLALFTCYAISLADSDHRRKLFRLPHCLRPPGTVHFILGITHPGLASTFHSMLATYTQVRPVPPMGCLHEAILSDRGGHIHGNMSPRDPPQCLVPQVPKGKCRQLGRAP